MSNPWGAEAAEEPAASSGSWKRSSKVILWLLVLGVLGSAAFGFINTSVKIKQINELTAEYDVDYVSLGGRGWGNSSWFDGVTLSVIKGDTVHTCKHVHLEDLRAGKPIFCKDGAVFHKQ